MCVKNRKIYQYTPFCRTCSYNRKNCNDFCAVYHYLLGNEPLMLPETFCESHCDYCDCEHTEEGCMLNRFKPYELYYERRKHVIRSMTVENHSTVKRV